MRSASLRSICSIPIWFHGIDALKVVTGIGAIERFVAQGKIGDDVALDHRLQQRPLKPGRIAQMAARYTIPIEPDPHKDIAAEALDEPQTFPHSRSRMQRLQNRTFRQTLQDLLDETHAFFHLADAHPDPGIHIAAGHHRNLEFHRVVGGIAWCLASVERASARTPDITPGAELARQCGGKNARRRGAILERSGIVIELDQLRKDPPNAIEQGQNAARP